MGRVGFDARSFFALGWQVTRVPPYVHPRTTGKYWKGMISARPSGGGQEIGPQGGQEIGLGSRNLRPRAEARPTGRAVYRERLGDWDGPMEV